MTAEFKLKRESSPRGKQETERDEFMSPDSLMEEFKAHAEDSASGECSQLYETGGQSAALKSASAEIIADEARESQSRLQNVTRAET